MLIQGNYIGVDVSGVKALGNGFSGGIVSTSFKLFPAYDNTIGGGVPGAGNVISGNGADGIKILGTNSQQVRGNIVQGNFIGTDASGNASLPNAGNGISLNAVNAGNPPTSSPATGNLIGGTDVGLGNVISHNALNGVFIDGASHNNKTIGNSIQSNAKAGVRVVTGNNNTISRNSIFANGALGIDLDAAGPNANSHCNANSTGANNLQNAPVLTAGAGSAFITATATDPSGNTSEFSNAVHATLSGNILNLLGTFDSKPSTTFTIEFFTNTAADPSGFGQGQTFLTSTSVTTDSSCSLMINNNVDLTQADMSVTLSFNAFAFQVGPDFGQEIYTGIVTNNGPATAHNVVFTDPLPAALRVSRNHGNLPSCQSPVRTTVGTCTVNGNTVTCNLGTMPAGSTATITIPVEALDVGSIVNTVSVAATETDPNLANNSSSVTKTSFAAIALIDHVDPSDVLVNNADIPVIIYGSTFFPTTTVTFTNPSNVSTPLTVTDFFDNQTCGFFTISFCQGLRVLLPHSLLGIAGNASFTVQNPGQSFTSPQAFKIAATCTMDPGFVTTHFGNDGTTLIALSPNVTVDPPLCGSWTASSTVPWAALLDTPPANGSGSVDFAIAPNPGAARSGDIKIAGTTFTLMQDAGTSSTCNFTLSSSSVTLPGTAGPGSVGITASSQSCAYFVVAFPDTNPWIKVDPMSGLLVGNGTAHFTVAANPGGPRTGALMIGGVAFTVNQNPADPCFFSFSASSAKFPTNASTGSVGINASQPVCAWTATSDSPWVTITSGASGTGSGTIQYSVATNSGDGRNAVITAGNLTSSPTFNINQASANACTFALSPSSVNVPSEGTSNRFSLIPSFQVCNWTASSNDPSALAVTSALSGRGSQLITYVVTPNPTSSPRTLTLIVGCQTFTVHQDGTVITAPDLAMNKSHTGNFTVGVNGVYTLTVGNVGTAPTSGTITVSDTLPTGLGFVSGTGTGWTCSAVAQVVTCTNAGPIANGANSVITLTVSVAAAAVPSVTNTAAVSDPNDGNPNGTDKSSSNPTTVNAVPAPDLMMVKSHTGNFTVGVNGVYTVTVSNVGTAPTTGAITATDTLPAGLGFVSGTGTGWTCSAVAQLVTCTNPGPIANGANSVITLTVSVGAAAFPAVTNTAMVSDPGDGNPNGTDKSSTNPTTVTAPDLSMGKSHTGDFLVGVNGTYTLTITNVGNASTTGAITVTDTLPAGLGFVSGTGTGWTCSAAGQVVTCTNPGPFAPTAMSTITLTVSTGTAGLVTNTAMVSTAGDINPNNNSASDPTTINNPAPTLTNIMPNAGYVGQGVAMTLTGTGFNSSSVVKFGTMNNTGGTVSNGGATLTISLPGTELTAVGIVSVTVFNPTPGGGTSTGQNFTISDFTVSSPTGEQTKPAGTPAMFEIDLGTQGGSLPSDATLSVTGLPPASTGTFSTTTFMHGSTGGMSTLTITTTSRSAAQAPPTREGPRSPLRPIPLLTLALALLGAAILRRPRERWAAAALLVALVVGLAGYLGGCNGGFPGNAPSGTPAGTYPITVTGTSGSVQHSTTVRLTVQ